MNYHVCCIRKGVQIFQRLGIFLQVGMKRNAHIWRSNGLVHFEGVLKHAYIRFISFAVVGLVDNSLEFVESRYPW